MILFDNNQIKQETYNTSPFEAQENFTTRITNNPNLTDDQKIKLNALFKEDREQLATARDNVYLKMLNLCYMKDGKETAFQLSRDQLFTLIPRFAQKFFVAVYFNVSNAETHKPQEFDGLGDIAPIYIEFSEKGLIDAFTKIDNVLDLWYQHNPKGLALNINAVFKGEKLIFASKDDALAYDPLKCDISTRDRLKKALDDIKIHIENINNEIQKANSELAQQKINAPKTTKKLNENLEEQTAKIQELRNELNDINNSINRKKGQRKCIEKEFNNPEDQSFYKKQKNKIETELIELQKKQEKLQEKLAQLKNNIKNTQQQLIEHSQSIEKQQTKISELRGNINRLKELEKSLKENNDKINNNLNNKTNKLQQLNAIAPYFFESNNKEDIDKFTNFAKDFIKTDDFEEAIEKEKYFIAENAPLELLKDLHIDDIKDSNKAKDKIFIYHLTPIDNLDSIIHHGLLNRNKVLRLGLLKKDIADSGIIEGRGRSDINSYVPFHFFPHTAFDYVVKRDTGKTNLCYITIRRDIAKILGAKIIQSHPLTKIEQEVSSGLLKGLKCSMQPPILNYDEGFAKIDWNVFGNVTQYNNYIKQARIAECLIPDSISSDYFALIAAYDENTKSKIENILHNHNKNILVAIIPEWFMSS